ncbi:MAG: undecaprenyldiphospho-muramoylpentapeptide beta-N-acetylglucosaminyltransferase [Atopobiaceae bacterium]|nr:undecaprenyldiphospho-muramoylpentapeptide beta-N-acetylglucosaminyltransferase [Atopobiaceae bacterium]
MSTAARKLKIAIAAGGTAGHITPALALAEELSARGHELSFFGQERRLEGSLVPEAGFDLFNLEVSGLDRSRPWTAVSALVRLARARRQLSKHFAATGVPNVAVGFGAYVELALGSWCERHGIPVVLHEQNSVPGLANKLLAGKATRVCLSFPAARAAFEGKARPEAVRMTGNPIRSSVIAGDRERGRKEIGATNDTVVLLVFGGSLGARSINECVIANKEELLAHDQLIIVHSSGKDEFEQVQSSLNLTAEQAKRWQLKSYVNNMGDMLAAADLVLSRSGASSIAEIAALAVPSILVPYPLATEDHQRTNASLLGDVGAAVIFSDDEMATDEFRSMLHALIDDESRRSQMRQAALSLGQARAAALLADEVEAAALQTQAS